MGSSPSDNCVGDAILENEIYDNVELGIDLGNDGVTLNNSSGHTGPNLFQDFPVLASALTFDGQTTIAGTISGAADTTYLVELFSNATADASGYGQGQTYLTFADVTTNATGTASFRVATPTAVPVGQFITATATDPSGDTSEFSADIKNLTDTTPPSSHVVNSLGTSQTSDTFPVSVTFSDSTGPAAPPLRALRRSSYGSPSTTEPSPCPRP